MEEDFELWYRQEHPRVLASCVALSGDTSAAAEAVDEAFARALERWSSVSEMSSPGGWVQIVALNQIRRVIRRRQLERILSFQRWGVERDPGPAAVPDPDLWNAVAALPTRQRLAIVLRYVHDLPETAIAEVMGIARGTVASTLAAAQASLRRALSDSSEVSPAGATKEGL